MYIYLQYINIIYKICFMTLLSLQESPDNATIFRYFSEVKELFRDTPEALTELKKEDLQEVHRLFLRLALNTQDDIKRSLIITNFLALGEILESLERKDLRTILKQIPLAVGALLKGFEFSAFTQFQDFERYLVKKATTQWSQVQLKAFLQNLSDKNILAQVSSSQGLEFFQKLFWIPTLQKLPWDTEMVKDFVALVQNLHPRQRKIIKSLFFGLAGVKASPDAVMQGAGDWILQKYDTPKHS